MKKEDAKKRFISVKGVPLVPLTAPRPELRKQMTKISPVSEEDIKFNNFFDFEEELAETESARKQFERMEEERLQREKALALAQANEPEKDSFVTLEEDLSEQVIEIVKAKPEIGTKIICKSKKSNGQPCKSLAVKGGEFCKSHSNQ